MNSLKSRKSIQNSLSRETRTEFIYACLQTVILYPTSCIVPTYRLNCELVVTEYFLGLEFEALSGVES